MEDLIDIVLERKGVPVTTSLIVAEKFEKRHDIVLRSIEDTISGMDNETAKLWFHKTTYKTKENRKSYPLYEMNRDGFSLIVMGFTGEKALRWKIHYIKAFDVMEEYIKSVQTAKMDYPALTQAIKETHDEPKNYHFSNELNMINRIVLGTDAKHFKQEHGVDVKESSIRPYLTAWQIKAVEALQRADIGLVMSGMDFQSRKILLTQYFNNCLMPKGVNTTV